MELFQCRRCKHQLGICLNSVLMIGSVAIVGTARLRCPQCRHEQVWRPSLPKLTLAQPNRVMV